MNRIISYSIFASVLCVVVLSGCAKDRTQEQIVAQDAPAAAEVLQNDEAFVGGITGLLAMGKPQECVWRGDDEQGVTYVDGAQMRAEVSSAEGTMIMVNDGTWMYAWDTATKKGQKFKVADMEKMQERFVGLAQDVDETVEHAYVSQNYMEQEHVYTCKKWHTDAEKFMVPDDVVFEDMSVMFEQARKAMEGVAQQCENLPEPQRTTCMEAMTRFAQ